MTHLQDVVKWMNIHMVMQTHAKEEAEWTIIIITTIIS